MDTSRAYEPISTGSIPSSRSPRSPVSASLTCSCASAAFFSSSAGWMLCSACRKQMGSVATWFLLAWVARQTCTERAVGKDNASKRGK
jgi:hypothetical protein